MSVWWMLEWTEQGLRYPLTKRDSHDEFSGGKNARSKILHNNYELTFRGKTYTCHVQVFL
jgi:hypothetical protein